MKPLVVLLAAFVICLIAERICCGEYAVNTAGRIAMAIMFIFTSIGHFKFAKGMSLMIPEAVPFKVPLVYATGIFEVLAGISLLAFRFNTITAWLMIAFLILIVPANIYAALKHVDFEKGNYEGKGPLYLWFRIPLQALFILWIYFFIIY